MGNAMPVADEVKALVQRLRLGASDPMWDAHCEMSKATINQAADLIERLARAEPAVPVAGWVHLESFLQAYDDEPDHRMVGAAIDREDDMLSFGDLRQISAAPPRTPDVKAVALALAVDEYADRHGINPEAEKIAGTDHFDNWFAQSRPSFERAARRAIAAMTGEAGHG